MINFLLFLVWAVGLVGAILLESNMWYTAVCLFISIAAGVAMAKRSDP